MIEERDAQAFRLVGEIVGDAGAGEDDEADGQRFEQRVVTFERGGFAVTGPVGLEDDLCDVARVASNQSSDKSRPSPMNITMPSSSQP